MKLNPCSKCKCTTQQLVTPSPYSTNPNTLALAACKSLMQRYGVDGKMVETAMPDYDRRLAHMLVDEGVLFLCKGLYQQK